MQNEKIDKMMVEIASIESVIKSVEIEIASFSQTLSEIENKISQNEANLKELINQRKDLKNQIDSFGFLKSIFKQEEKARIDGELSTISGKIDEQRNVIEALKNEAVSLSQQKSEAENQLQKFHQGKTTLHRNIEEEQRREAEAQAKREKHDSLHTLASNGDMNAMFDLAIWYLDDKNNYQYMNWLEIAANFGHKESQKRLGLAYRKGEDSVVKDWKKALIWLEKAAEQGDAESQYETGDIYLLGRDKVFDDFNENSMFYCDKAASWFEKAANNNHIEATRQLSLMHRGNMFSKADEKESVELTKKLAYTFNDPLGMLSLGSLYFHERGVQKDDKKAANLIMDGISKHKGEIPVSFSYEAVTTLIIVGCQESDPVIIRKGLELAETILAKKSNVDEVVEYLGANGLDVLKNIISLGNNKLAELKIVGKWECKISLLEELCVHMSYDFKSDGTYNYTNHITGVVVNSRYSVEGNVIRYANGHKDKFNLNGRNLIMDIADRECTFKKV